ncbi:MAG TPA: NAD(P)-binding domain-containing protein [Nitriliruptorales bacterium]|nr:NAD(P)-binding domain-containing protein [Nitriliruptorales bacterium]
MTDRPGSEYVETLVIGGGQSGLAVGYHLSQRGLPYAIVDANDRIGDAWRNRWDSLRLFTPNRLNALPGMPHHGYHWKFPSKDEMADYLESYARHFDIPVETGVRVERLSREGDRLVAVAGNRRVEADNVVVAMSSWQQPRVPEFASDLDPSIVQLHVAEYRNPGQLQEGAVLVVGAGNSGAEVAMELARTHDVWLSGPDTGQIPFRPESVAARLLMPFVGRIIFHRVLTTSTPIGRKARPKMVPTGEPLLRVKPRDLAAAGVERVPRVTAVLHGQPQLEDGRRIDVANVVWCTGFDPGFSWIDLPVIEEGMSEPDHHRGVVGKMPGLYFVGLKFLYSVSSEQIHGVGRDAAHIADAIAARRGKGHRDPQVADRQDQLESA